jgi:hypothetical protein
MQPQGDPEPDAKLLMDHRPVNPCPFMGTRKPRFQAAADGPVRLAEDLDDVGGPGLQAARPELRDRAASPDDVLAALLDLNCRFKHQPLARRGPKG